MKHPFLTTVTCIAIMTFSCMNTKAYTIKKGTKSLGGSTSSIFRITDSRSDDDIHTFDLDLRGGYFIINNLELGASFSFYIQDTENYRKRTTYSLSPYITYHKPLDTSSNLYFGGEIGFAHFENKYDFGLRSEGDLFIFSANLGWEYFLNPYVAMNIGLGYDRIEADLKNFRFSEDEENIFKLEWGLTIYLHNPSKLH